MRYFIKMNMNSLYSRGSQIANAKFHWNQLKSFKKNLLTNRLHDINMCSYAPKNLLKIGKAVS